MTKRSVEQTVRDALASAEDEVAKKVGLVERARHRFALATGELDEAKLAVEEAEARVIRARNALAAITGRTLDEIIEDTKARAATTGTHDPGTMHIAEGVPMTDYAVGGPVDNVPGTVIVGESGPESDAPEVVSPLRKKRS